MRSLLLLVAAAASVLTGAACQTATVTPSEPTARVGPASVGDATVEDPVASTVHASHSGLQLVLAFEDSAKLELAPRTTTAPRVTLRVSEIALPATVALPHNDLVSEIAVESDAVVLTLRKPDVTDVYIERGAPPRLTLRPLACQGCRHENIKPDEDEPSELRCVQRISGCYDEDPCEDIYDCEQGCCGGPR